MAPSLTCSSTRIIESVPRSKVYSLLLSLVLLLLPAGCNRGSLPSKIGEAAPDFTVTDSTTTVRLSSLRGKVVVLNFWATWCAPCKIETPWMVELRNQYAAQGFEILAVSMDDLDRGEPEKLSAEKKEIAAFVQKMHMPYPVLIGGDSISKPYGGLDDLPTSFFVDRNGTIVASQLGLTSKDEIEAKIKQSLAK